MERLLRKKGYYLHLTELLPNTDFYLFILFFIYLYAGSHHVAQPDFRLMILCCRLQGPRFTWFYFYVYECLLTCMFVDYMCIPGAHRSHRLFPWNWSNKWLLATMWLLRIKLGSAGRASSALNHWVTSSAPFRVLGLQVCTISLVPVSFFKGGSQGAEHVTYIRTKNSLLPFQYLALHKKWHYNIEE